MTKYNKYNQCCEKDYNKYDCHTSYQCKPKPPCPPPNCPYPCFGAIKAAKLCPDKEVTPPVGDCGFGWANVTLNNDNTLVRYCFIAKELSSDVTGAHIHQGAIGTDGAILKTLCFDKYDDPRYFYNNCKKEFIWAGEGCWSCYDETEPLTSVASEAIACDFTYVNIHTVNNTAGEIRGQLCTYCNVPF